MCGWVLLLLWLLCSFIAFFGALSCFVLMFFIEATYAAVTIGKLRRFGRLIVSLKTIYIYQSSCCTFSGIYTALAIQNTCTC